MRVSASRSEARTRTERASQARPGPANPGELVGASSSLLQQFSIAKHVAMIALHVAAGLAVSLWPQPSKVVINDPTLVTFTGNFAFISVGESSEELQNAIHRYTDLLHASGSSRA